MQYISTSMIIYSIVYFFKGTRLLSIIHYCGTYNFKHWDFVQLQGFLGLAPVGSIGVLQRKESNIQN